MKVSVVGLGYVGSVAAAGLAYTDHDVLGVDIDRGKIETYRRGDVPFYEPGLSDLIGAGLQHGNLRFLHTTEVLEPLGEAIIIATGTPSSDTGGTDLSYAKGALSWVKERQPDGGLVIMKSTVPPGTGLRLTETVLGGEAFDYVSNPEFLREGQAIADWFNPDRMIVGVNDQEVVPLVKDLYNGVEAPPPQQPDEPLVVGPVAGYVIDVTPELWPGVTAGKQGNVVSAGEKPLRDDLSEVLRSPDDQDVHPVFSYRTLPIRLIVSEGRYSGIIRQNPEDVTCHRQQERVERPVLYDGAFPCSSAMSRLQVQCISLAGEVKFFGRALPESCVPSDDANRIIGGSN